MPNPPVADGKHHERFYREGDGKRKAPGIAPSAALRGRPRVGRREAQSGSYYDWTMDQLKKQAKEFGLTGYSTMTKDDLIYELRKH